MNKPLLHRTLVLLLLATPWPFTTPLYAQHAACCLDHDHALDEDPFYLRVTQAAKAVAPAELPLKGERSLKINTNEGTWLSLDVHPDGKTIVFAMLGDLYQLPITGGKATQLTSGIAFDSAPRFSPDGKSIGFISDRDGAENAHILELSSGAIKQITKSRDEYYQSLEWTPDGQYLVIAKGVGTPKLNLYHKDGGSGTLLIAKPDDIKTIEPAISPDGNLIWYANRKGMWDYNAQLPQYQLNTFNRKTGEIEVKTSRYGSAFSPTLSNDGKWLVYGTRYNTETGLVLQNLATGEDKWLAYPVQHDEQESLASMGVLPAMSFTPDNKQVLAAYGGKIYAIAVDGSGAKEIPFKVETEMMIGPKLKFNYPIKDDAEIIANAIRDPAISPDGTKAVFTALDRLYIMDYPNGTPTRMTSMELTEAQPAWSPDGKSIAYVTWDGKDGSIYKIAPRAKSKPQLLTEKGLFFQEPVWSDDSKKIVFIQGLAVGYRTGTTNRTTAKQSLSWIPATGGSSTMIAKATGSNPHFAGHDDRIYLFSPSEGLISVNWNGQDKRSHAKFTGITTYDFSNTNGGQFSFFRRTASPARIIKSPAGNQAMVLMANEVYVVDLPATGGETPVISLADVTKSQFPSWKLTQIGAEFPTWSKDGKKIYWSLGPALFGYDLTKKDDSDYLAAEKRIEVRFKNDIPQGEILLQGGRIITMKGDEVIENGDILIRNNRIVAVGVAGSLQTSTKVQVIDVKGKTITPGFFDLHSHMLAPAGIHVDQLPAYTAQLAYGVTTTRNPQPGTTDILTYGNKVEAGQTVGPRLYSTGPGVAYWAYNLKDLDHTRKVLKQYSAYYNTKTIKMYAVGNRQQRQWIIMAAKEQGLMPTTEGNLDMKLNLTEVLDGYPGHEHAYPMFPWYKDFVSFVAQSQIAFTSTFLLDYGGPCAENYFYSKENIIHDDKLNYFSVKEDIDKRGRRRNSWFADEEYVFPKEAKILDDVLKAGGLPAVGAHGQLQGLGYHWELWATQSGGMRNIDVIRLATINGATAIGLENDLGSIEQGKLADLVIMDKNPLENIRNTNTISYVMKNGRLYSGDTLDEVAPVKRKATGFDWHPKSPVDLPGIATK